MGHLGSKGVVVIRSACLGVVEGIVPAVLGCFGRLPDALFPGQQWHVSRGTQHGQTTLKARMFSSMCVIRRCSTAQAVLRPGEGASIHQDGCSCVSLNERCVCGVYLGQVLSQKEGGLPLLSSGRISVHYLIVWADLHAD